jgi:flagellin
VRINTNLTALSAHRNLSGVNDALATSLERLSSGLRINQAADDAAGMAISEQMTSQIRGLQQARRNAQDGVSMIRTAEGALMEIHAILQRMRVLSVQASNDSLTAADRSQIQGEINQLNREITRIGNTAEFNTRRLVDGSASEARGALTGRADVFQRASLATIDVNPAAGVQETFVSAAINTTDSFRIRVVANTPGPGAATDLVVESAFLGVAFTGLTVTAATGAYTVNFGNGVIATVNRTNLALNDTFVVNTRRHDGGKALDDSLTMQVGANQGQDIRVSIGDMRAAALALTHGTGTAERLLRVESQFSASAAVTFLTTAIGTVSSERARLGAVQNRFQHTMTNLGVATENIVAARSRIQDVDMAEEMMQFTRNQILSQAGTAMLAQANQQPQTVLQLLR